MSSRAFEIVRGDTTTISVQVLDSDGNPIDLTGYTIFFTAKKSTDDIDEEAVLEMEAENGDDQGMVDINFTADDTTYLEPRSYWWDIQLENDGVISSTVPQLFKVVADVTRRVESDS